ALAYRVPVVLAIPYDVATLDIGDIPAVPGPGSAAPLAPASEFAQASLDRLTAELAAAKRPVLLAGRGAWLSGAQDELGALAATTGALTATSALGRNVFPEPEFDLGVAGGFGAPAAMERIRQADVAVVFGASLNQFTMRFGELVHPSTSVWQVDTDDRATNSRVGGFIRSDARLAAGQLVSRLRTCAPEPDSRGSGPWRETVDTAADRAYEAGTEFASDGRHDPRAAAARLDELLPSGRAGSAGTAWLGQRARTRHRRSRAPAPTAAGRCLRRIATPRSARLAGGASPWSSPMPPMVPRSTSTGSRAWTRPLCSSTRS